MFLVISHLLSHFVCVFRLNSIYSSNRFIYLFSIRFDFSHSLIHSLTQSVSQSVEQSKLSNISENVWFICSIGWPEKKEEEEDILAKGYNNDHHHHQL